MVRNSITTSSWRLSVIPSTICPTGGFATTVLSALADLRCDIILASRHRRTLCALRRFSSTKMSWSVLLNTGVEEARKILPRKLSASFSEGCPTSIRRQITDRNNPRSGNQPQLNKNLSTLTVKSKTKIISYVRAKQQELWTRIAHPTHMTHVNFDCPMILWRRVRLAELSKKC